MVEQERYARSLIGILALILVGYVLSEEPDIERILTRHQQYRNLTHASDMIKLTWSVNLERIAASLLNKCPTSTEVVRSQTKHLQLGANLGSAPYPSPIRDGYPQDIQTAIIDQWGSQRAHFYPNEGCSSHPCDLWWQVVWSKASQVGCSLKVCSDKTVMICIYNSRAHKNTNAPYKFGEACLDCPPGYQTCENLMCVADKEPPVESKPISVLSSANYNKSSDSNEKSNIANRLAVLTTCIYPFILGFLI